mmetsp:Transcript_69323/g.115224  ORF Transcript_69323/g.115224 Transcript_69323/m.115224 type:complete len:183 (-) Transcript_69323:405-953(-)
MFHFRGLYPLPDYKKYKRDSTDGHLASQTELGSCNDHQSTASIPIEPTSSATTSQTVSIPMSSTLPLRHLPAALPPSAASASSSAAMLDALPIAATPPPQQTASRDRLQYVGLDEVKSFFRRVARVQNDNASLSSMVINQNTALPHIGHQLFLALVLKQLHQNVARLSRREGHVGGSRHGRR